MTHHTHRRLKPLLPPLVMMLCLAAGAAQAQFGGTGGRGRGMGPTGLAGTSPRGEAFAGPAARLNQFGDQLTALRLRLQLEGPQNAAWNDFQRKASDWATEEFRGRYASAEETALQALERRANDAHRRQALLDALLASARLLNELLHPEQRSQFDQQLPTLLP